jgi:hypothetical protein
MYCDGTGKAGEDNDSPYYRLDGAKARKDQLRSIKVYIHNGRMIMME